MSRTRSKKSKGFQLPLFIQKLIEILDVKNKLNQDPSISDIISWTSTDDSFNIKSIGQFTEAILPRFFKHNNFSSFIRQLNMYGFRKIRHDDGQNVYQNQHFKRGNRNLLKNIKRKINQDKDDKLALYQESYSNITLSKQIQSMKNKQKDIQQICRHLLIQNQKLIDENNSMMKKMRDQSRNKQRKIEHLLFTFMTSNQNKQPTIMNEQGNENAKNMLSIMSGGNSADFNVLNQKSDQTPLQVLTNAFSRNKNMRQFKNMLQNYYNSDDRPVNNPSPMKNNARMTRRQNPANPLGDQTNQHSVKIKANNPNLNGSIGFNANNSINMSPRVNNNASMTNDQDDNGFDFSNQQSSQQQFFDHSLQPDLIKPDLPLPHDEDDGFISINDFMNLDDQNQRIQNQDNMNLQESR